MFIRIDVLFEIVLSGVAVVPNLTNLNLVFLGSLLIAHFLADFYLQPDSWVDDKIKLGWKSRYLYLHGFIAGFLSFIASAIFVELHIAICIFISVFLSHIVIDGAKTYLSKPVSSQPATKENIRLLIIDQGLHIAILFAIWLVLFHSQIIEFLKSLPDQTLFASLAIILGYILIFRPAGFFIQYFTKPWREEGSDDESLKNAGKYIGFFERFIIFNLVLFQQYLAIGFLVTAKSILRYSNTRKIGEYVLMGTFLSFSIAIGAGLLVCLVLKLLGVFL